jgi:uncharacterized membrane protein YagU involved in acid resistance
MKLAVIAWTLSFVMVMFGTWEKLRHWEGVAIFIFIGLLAHLVGVTFMLVDWSITKKRVESLSKRVDQMC